MLEEIKMYDDSPDELIHDLFIQTMWSGSDLGAPTIGFRRDGRGADAATTCANTCVSAMRPTRSSSRPPATSYTTASSNSSPRSSPGSPDAASRRCPSIPRSPRRSRSRRRTREQAYVVLGHARPLAARRAALCARPCSTRSSAAGMSSRLFQEIREKRGLVYSVYSFQAALPRGGSLRRLRPGRRPRTCRPASTSSRPSIRARPPPTALTEAELSLAKEHIKGNLTLSLESTSSRMIRLGRNEFALGRQRRRPRRSRRSRRGNVGDVRR